MIDDSRIPYAPYTHNCEFFDKIRFKIPLYTNCYCITRASEFIKFALLPRLPLKTNKFKTNDNNGCKRTIFQQVFRNGVSK